MRAYESGHVCETMVRAQGVVYRRKVSLGCVLSSVASLGCATPNVYDQCIYLICAPLRAVNTDDRPCSKFLLILLSVTATVITSSIHYLDARTGDPDSRRQSQS